MNAEMPFGEALSESQSTRDDRAQPYLTESDIDEEVLAKEKKKKDTVTKTRKRNVVRLGRSLIRMLAEVPDVITLQNSKLIVRDYGRFEALIPDFFAANKLRSVERQLNQFGFSKRALDQNYVVFVKTRGDRVYSVDDLRNMERIPVYHGTRGQVPNNPYLFQSYLAPPETQSKDFDSFFLPLPASSIEVDVHQVSMAKLRYFQESTIENSHDAHNVRMLKKPEGILGKETFATMQETTLTPRKKQKETGEDDDNLNS